ncbi:MAG: recombinase RecA [Planctomycetota bacterium]
MAKETKERKEPDVEDRRKQALSQAILQIEKQFGKGSIMTFKGGDLPKVEGISTGSLSLDMALGGRGVPRGRVIEIFGPDASGKTTLSLHIAANAQRAGGIAAFVDAEHAMDPTYARLLGVNLDDLLISQPDTGEQALEITEMLVRSNAIDIVIVDSVAALVPKAEIEGEMGDQFMGLQARLMSQALRKLTGAISKSKTCVVFINQIREKIGVMFGSPETTPGGRALKFYASVRIEVRRREALKDGDRVVGSRVRAKVVKNKVAPPFRWAEFDMLHASGISLEGDVLDMATELSIVSKAGTWFAYGDLKLGQGRERARQFLTENPELLAELKDKVQMTVGAGEVVRAPVARSKETPDADE